MAFLFFVKEKETKAERFLDCFYMEECYTYSSEQNISNMYGRVWDHDPMKLR